MGRGLLYLGGIAVGGKMIGFLCFLMNFDFALQGLQQIQVFFSELGRVHETGFLNFILFEFLKVGLRSSVLVLLLRG